MTVARVLCVFLLGCAAMAQNGAGALFDAKCANCHGRDGKAGKATKMHVADLTSKAVQQMGDDEMYETIAKGTQHKEYPHAFEFQGLTKDQIRGLVAYIRVLGKKK